MHKGETTAFRLASHFERSEPPDQNVTSTEMIQKWREKYFIYFQVFYSINKIENTEASNSDDSKRKNCNAIFVQYFFEEITGH